MFYVQVTSTCNLACFELPQPLPDQLIWMLRLCFVNGMVWPKSNRKITSPEYNSVVKVSYPTDPACSPEMCAEDGTRPSGPVLMAGDYPRVHTPNPSIWSLSLTC